MPEHETVPCPKCSSMATQTSNTRSAWGAPTLKWSCRTCGKVAYDSEAQRLLAEQQRKRRQHEREHDHHTQQEDAIMARADSSKAAAQQPASAPDAPAPPEAQAAPVATPSPAPVAVPPALTLTEAELEARYAALQQARNLRAERDELAASVAMLQRKLAELETDVAYAMRRALAPVGAA